MAQNLKKSPYETKHTQEAWKLIQDATSITLLTHYKPDGDGMGACAAFEAALENMTGPKKNIETVYPTESEFKQAIQAKNVKINTHTRYPDLLIAFDTANYKRLYFPEDFQEIPLINIDHHISNSIEGTYNFNDPVASSACEVLYNLLVQWQPDLITPYVAECLLSGILYDSQVFHTQNTTARTLRVSADLIDLGANLFKLKTEMISHINPGIIKVWSTFMSKIRLTTNQKAAWGSISQADLAKAGTTLSSLVGFNNFLAEISGVDVIALLYETEPGQTKITLRSKVADVNAIASKFGGGGHKNAAGALTDTPIEETTNQLIKILEEL